ncbi:c-type cytochrome [Roseivivax sp. CAU 1761]
MPQQPPAIVPRKPRDKKMRSLVLAIMLAGPAIADEGDATRGSILYEVFCSTCHGASGRGDGDLARFLLSDPTDLTTLTTENGEEYPAVLVYRQIDGRYPLQGYSGEMPVFGPLLNSGKVSIYTPSGDPLVTGTSIDDLVAYLRSIQTKQ